MSSATWSADLAGVIIDTSIWIHYFRQPFSEVGLEVTDLLRQEVVLLPGVVLSELLRGTRSDEDYRSLRETLQGPIFLEPTRETWEETGRLLSAFDSQGARIPFQDALISALALENDYAVFTTDEHIRGVPGVKLYQL
jgi:predicted nucleic acid-binding protein